MTSGSMSWMTSLLLTVTSLCLMLAACHGFRLSRQHTAPAAATPRRHRREATGPQGGRNSPPLHKDRPVRHGVLLDAGSSSTKVKVYAYTPAKSLDDVPRVRLEKSERVRPGMSSFVGSSGGELRKYMEDVLGHATAVVPQRLHVTTPIYVMATAGMRVLSANEAKDLLSEVANVMRNASVNPFLFHQQHVNILAGEEEAVYAWVAVNYLRGFFADSHPTQNESVGVLEMGGGSMQVAFLPDSPLYQEEFQMYMGRRRFDLYAQTYLSYGSDYLTDQVRWRLLQQQQKRGEVQGRRFRSPCMLAGDNDTFEWEDNTYEVTGTGNVSRCEEVLGSILSPVESILCSPGPCAIGDTYQPAVGDHPFYAISAFLYAPQNLDAVEAGGVLNITKLRHNARKYCNLTVAQAVAQTGTKAKFASNDCLMGLYIPLLLTSALGFNENTRTITVAKDINGTAIDWALGAMIQHLSMTFMEDPDHIGPCHPSSDDPLSVDHVVGSVGSHPVAFTFTLMSLVALVHLL